ncbi:MAG: hypothetical protein KGI06_04265 [Candidatus Micrarchaeota archaeon]|nr:hypothetical protein [Candidatus Micrarchaeota archaeon]
MVKNFKDLPLDALFSKLHGLMVNLVNDIDSVIEDNKEIGMDAIKELRDEISGRPEGSDGAKDSDRLLKILNLFSEDKAVIEIIREDAEEWLELLDAIENSIKSQGATLTPDDLQEINAIKQLKTEVKHLVRTEDMAISTVPFQTDRLNALKRKRGALNVAIVCFGFVAALLLYSIVVYSEHHIGVHFIVVMGALATILTCIVFVADSANSSMMIRKMEKGIKKSEKQKGRDLLVLDLITNSKSFIDREVEISATVRGVLYSGKGQPAGKGRVNIYIEDGSGPWWYNNKVLVSLDPERFSFSTIELFRRLRRGDGVIIKGIFRKSAESSGRKPSYYIDAYQVSLVA